MYCIEAEGKTYEKAVQNALEKLEVSRERVTIEVLDTQKNKGLFNIGKTIRVRVTLKEVITDDEKKEKAELVLNKILGHMHIDHKINKIHESHEKIYIDLNSQDEGIMIGKRGRTINSVQYLLNLIYNKEHPIKKRIILDVGKYRKRREIMLRNLALRYAEKANETGTDVVLDPMSAEDRKIIHMTLDTDTRVRSFSRGTGEFRSLVITPFKK